MTKTDCFFQKNAGMKDATVVRVRTLRTRTERGSAFGLISFTQFSFGCDIGGPPGLKPSAVVVVAARLKPCP